MKIFTHAGKLLLAILLCTNLSAQAQTQSQSDALYQSLGGKPGISTFVNSFVALILDDARIKEQFKETDMVRLTAMLNEQFCELSGGPCKYSGRTMDDVHKDMEVTNAQFNALAEDLQIAMDKHQVPSSAQNKLIAKLAPMQRQVVTK